MTAVYEGDECETKLRTKFGQPSKQCRTFKHQQIIVYNSRYFKQTHKNITFYFFYSYKFLLLHSINGQLDMCDLSLYIKTCLPLSGALKNSNFH